MNHLDGVRILSEVQVDIVGGLILKVIAVIVLATIIGAFADIFSESFPCFTVMFFITSTIISTFIAIQYYKSVDPEYNYKVIIDSDISYQDIINTYDIIEQDGEIFTIRFKDGD